MFLFLVLACNSSIPLGPGKLRTGYVNCENLFSKKAIVIYYDGSQTKEELTKTLQEGFIYAGACKGVERDLF